MSTVQIDRLLDTVIRQGASDLHLCTGRKPTLRLNGALRNIDTKVLDSDDCVSLMKSITPERAQQELQEEGSADFGFAYGTEARFRVAVFRQRGDVSIALRLIPNKLLTFDEIGLPPICRELIRRPRGLFVVTGPTGSGKTTSLATMIDHINDNFDRHIVTVEDPIEYYHYHKKSIVNQREVGVDVPSFSECLRRVLRQDPDVILVGEMRDLETIEAALSVAETGHLCFATLHTNSAVQTINRIVDVFPPYQQSQVRAQLSFVLEGVLCQSLLPRSNGPGRALTLEVMVPNPAIRNLIREDKIHQIYSQMQIGQEKFGMQTMNQSLAMLHQRRLITTDEALGRSSDPDELRQLIGEAQPAARRAAS